MIAAFPPRPSLSSSLINRRNQAARISFFSPSGFIRRWAWEKTSAMAVRFPPSRRLMVGVASSF
jgi:hypothetical protein